MADYQDAFLMHLTRCNSLTEPDQITIFTAGLGEPLKTDVELQAPSTLEDAMGLARTYKRRSTMATPPPASAAPRSSSRPALSFNTSQQPPSCTGSCNRVATPPTKQKQRNKKEVGIAGR